MEPIYQSMNCTEESVKSTSMAFSVGISPKNILKKKEHREIEVLTLKHFSATPKLDFENVKVGLKKTLLLKVYNPSDTFVQIELKKFPFDKGFHIDENVIGISPRDNHLMEISWFPNEVGNVREIVIVESTNNLKLQIILLGNAKSNEKTKKARGRLPNQRKSIHKVEKKKVISKPQFAGKKKLKENIPNASLHVSKSSQRTKVLTSSVLGEINRVESYPNRFEPILIEANKKELFSEDDFPKTPIRRQTFVKDSTYEEREYTVETTDSIPAFNFHRETFFKQFPGIKEEFDDSLEQSKDENIFEDSLELEAEEVCEDEDSLVVMKDIPCKGDDEHIDHPDPTLRKRKQWVIESKKSIHQEINIECIHTTFPISKSIIEQEFNSTSDKSNEDSRPQLSTVTSTESTSLSNHEISNDIQRTYPILSDVAENFTYDASHLLLPLEDYNERRCSTSIKSKIPPMAVCDVSALQNVGKQLFSDQKIVEESLSHPSSEISVSSPNHNEDIKESEECKLSTRLSTETYISSPCALENEVNTDGKLDEFGNDQVLTLPVINMEETIGFMVSPKKKFKGNPKRPTLSKKISPRKKTGVALKTGVRSPNKCTRTEILRRKAALKKSSSLNCSSSRNTSRRLPQKKLSLIKPKVKSSIPQHPNPFAAKNMFYDEKWMDKQERGFTRWLNFFLTPPEDLSTTDNITKVDAGKLWLENKSTIEKAPTKEDLSFRSYTAKRKLNKLRRAACILFQSEPFVRVISKIEAELEKERIVIRSDKALHADLGIKQEILDMLICYNPLWLRIGLETIYGELLPLQSNNDIVGISRFIVRRLLNNPDICSMYAHSSVPHLYRPGFEEAIKKFTLKKFLLLIYFLDRAKLTRLIDHDPCLFCFDSKFKSSRDLLLTFSRDFLRGEGDLTKHLSYLGFVVSHEQKYLDEFNYAIENVSVDLRCGIRIMKVTSLLLKNFTMMQQARVPAISKLQKIHNIGVALKALETSSMRIMGGITSKDICEGHKEKTLNLLWQLIFKFQIEIMISKKKLKQEIEFLKKSFLVNQKLSEVSQWKTKNSTFPCDDDVSSMYFNSEILKLLLQWCQLVCAQYDFNVENFTVSFSDGRALCYLIHHYHPKLLRLSDINNNTTQNIQNANTSSDSDSFCENWNKTYSPTTGKPLFEEQLINERKNFRLAFTKMEELGGIPLLAKSSDMSNTIPDEKVVITLISYLNLRILNLSDEIKASRIIQLAWKKYKIRKNIVKRRDEEKSVVVIQRYFRMWRKNKQRILFMKSATRIQSCLRGYIVRRRFLRIISATRTLQMHCHAFYLGRLQQRKYFAMKNSAIVLQSHWRRILAQKELQRLKSIVCLQRHIRGFLARKHFSVAIKSIIKIQSWWKMITIKRQIQVQKSAVLCIENFYCSKLLMRPIRENYLKKKYSVLLLQSKIKSILCRRKYLRKKAAALTVQKNFKMFVARRRFKKYRHSALIIQRKFRANKIGYNEFRMYHIQRGAAICIQTWFKAARARKEYIANVKNVIKVQSQIRSFIARRQYQRLIKATIFIQRKVRSKKLMDKDLEEFRCARRASIIIQSYYKMWKVKKEVEKWNRNATLIQSTFKAFIVRRKYRTIIHSTRVLQKFIRLHIQKSKDRALFLTMRKSAIIIQSTFRMWKVRKTIWELHATATIIQSAFRGFIDRKRYRVIYKSTTVLQKYFRLCIQKSKDRALFLAMQNSAIIIQSTFRMWKVKRTIRDLHSTATVIQSAFRGFLDRKQYRNLRQSTIILQQYVRLHIQMSRDRKRFVNMKKSAIIIQSFYRRYKAVKDFHLLKSVISLQSLVRRNLSRKEFLSKRNAAISIQKYFRRYIAHRDYEKLRCSCLVIQQRFRSHKLQKESQASFHLKKSACILIQSHFRGYLVRKDNHGKNSAAVCIQKHFRGMIVRKQYEAKKLAVIRIQRKWLATIEANKQRFDYIEKRISIIKLQALLRGVAARKNFSLKRSKAIIIQSSFRCFIWRKKFLEAKKSAIIIQKYWRSKQLTKKIRNDFLEIKKKVTICQACIRQHFAMNEYRRKYKAVRKIQAFAKMIHERRNYLKKLAAVKLIQARLRAYHLGKFERLSYLEKLQKIILLQSSIRGYISRQKFKNFVVCTVKIQRWYKSIRERRAYLKKQSAIITIQRRFLSHLKTKAERIKYLSTVDRIVKVQSCVRRFVCRRDFIRNKKNAIAIQTWYRSSMQRHKYAVLRKHVILIQQKWRAHLAMRKIQEEYHCIKRSIVVIQAYMRGCIARKEFNDKMNCVLKIQAMQRCRIERQRYLDLRHKTCLIQRWYKSILKTRLAVEDFKNMKDACIVIQSNFRCYRQRQRYLKQKCAVITIQSYVRSWIACKLAEKRKTAILTLQRHYSCYLTARKCKEEYLHLRSASICIQSFYRRRLAKRQLLHLKSAIKIQAFYRMYRQRRKYNELRCKVIQLQCFIRRWHAFRKLMELRKLNNAASVLQSALRIYLAKNKLQLLKEERLNAVNRFSSAVFFNLKAIVIQRCYRNACIRRNAKQELDLIIKIQRWMRSKITRMNYLKMMNGFRRLQIISRKWLSIRSKKAIVIQATVRSWLARKHVAKQKESIVFIQACWRGYLVRKRSKNVKIRKIRRNLIQATKNATNGMKLFERTKSALDYLLEYKSITTILAALEHLDVVTKLSPLCCEKMVEGNAVKTIYKLVQSCNRSLPHMEVIKYSVNILLNLSKYEKTAHAVRNVEGSADALLELMSIFREKGATIFTKCSTVLCILAQDENFAMNLLNNSRNVEKIRSMHYLVERQAKMKKDKIIMKEKSSSVQLKSTKSVVGVSKKKSVGKLKIQPDWILGKSHFREFYNTYDAINHVFSQLSLNQK